MTSTRRRPPRPGHWTRMEAHAAAAGKPGSLARLAVAPLCLDLAQGRGYNLQPPTHGVSSLMNFPPTRSIRLTCAPDTARDVMGHAGAIAVHANGVLEGARPIRAPIGLMPASDRECRRGSTRTVLTLRTTAPTTAMAARRSSATIPRTP